MQQQENAGYSFENSEQFNWNREQWRTFRYQKIKECLDTVRELCYADNREDDSEDRVILGAMAEIVESLEKTFVHQFSIGTGHVVSPKSDEPWD